MGKGPARIIATLVLVAGQLVAGAPRADAAAPGFAPGRTTRVSVNSAGMPSNPSVILGTIAAGGRYVTFASNATNIVPGAGGSFEVYRHDRLTGITDIVSLSSTGTPVPNAIGNYASADGRFIVFDSADPGVVPGDANNATDVFVRDMLMGTTRAVSADAAGVLGDRGGVLNHVAGARAISDDGRYVLFGSTSTNLVPDTNAFAHQYVKDLVMGAVVRASVDNAGNPGNDSSPSGSISGNGRVVAFLSGASNFSPLVTNHGPQIFVRDLDGARTTLESVRSAGVPNTFFLPGASSLSFDGRYLAFETRGSLDTRDVDLSAWDVYLRDRVAATTTLVSLGSPAVLFADNRQPSISEDGRFVAYAALDGSIVAGDNNNTTDIYLYDRDTLGTTLVSLTTSGQQATGPSGAPSVSADGNAVAFLSTALNLVPVPPSTAGQIYVRDFVTNTAPTVALPSTATATVGTELVLSGSFSDPDASQTWTATVNFGDGTSAPLALAPDKSFEIRHTYRGKGTYSLVVSVADSANALGTATVFVNAKFRPVIFVPGLAGSELEAVVEGISPEIDDGHGGRQTHAYGGSLNPVWLNVLAALLPGEEDYFDLLKYDASTGRPIVTDIHPNDQLVKVPGSPYATLQHDFELQGFVEGKDLFVFAYDWRDPVERSGDWLDAKVGEVLRITGSDSVDIVAHSLGGLVTRSFLLRGGERAHAARVVLLGAPNLGTPQFGYALLGGTCLPSGVPVCIISSDETADVLSALPVAPQLAPSAEYYRVFPNVVSDPGDRFPTAYIDARYSVPDSPERGSRAQFLAREREAGVPQSYVDAADAFHADDATWISRIPASTRLTLVAGTGIPTVGQVIETWSRECEPVRNVNGRFVCGPLPRIVPRIEWRALNGDGTVVDESASLKESIVAAPNVDVIYGQWEHGGLTSSDGLTIAFDLLRGVDPTIDPSAKASRTDGYMSGTIISVHSPVEIVVTDASGRRSGSADGNLAFSEIPGARYDRIGDSKFVALSIPTAVSVTLNGTGGGGSLVRVRRIQNGVMTSQSVFTHVPTLANTHGTFAVDATGAVSTLQLDIDGDGVIDEVLTPTTLTAAAADDMQPPAIAISSPDSRVVVGSVRLAWTATDTLSGVAFSIGTVDGGSATFGSGELVALGSGTHRVDVYAEDRAGNSSSASATVTADAYTWLQPAPAEVSAGRVIPLRFRITTASGSFVSDPSVTVTLNDAAGRTVLTLHRAETPAAGVAVEGGAAASLQQYHADLATRGLASGAYVVTISFDSPSLVGQFSQPLSVR